MTDTRDGRDIVERLRHAPVVFGTEMFGATRLLEDAASEIERLRSQRVAVPEGWQDISTAPRDGSVILGFQPHVGIIQMAWDAHLQSVDKWICRNDDCPLPTHWMPLPAPPAAAIRALAHGGDDGQA